MEVERAGWDPSLARFDLEGRSTLADHAACIGKTYTESSKMWLQSELPHSSLLGFRWGSDGIERLPIVPHWFPALVLANNRLHSWMPLRFSLRTLLNRHDARCRDFGGGSVGDAVDTDETPQAANRVVGGVGNRGGAAGCSCGCGAIQ